MKLTRFWFGGYRGCGTWPLTTSIDATDAFNAVLLLHGQGWHHLKLLAEESKQ